MGGRLYDPALRRFTTADPYVTEPLNPQGLNRYSYVQNNPMSLTDPSGFYSFEITIQTGQGQQQVSVTIPDMQVSYAPTMPSPQQMADMSNAASNLAGQGVQEQHAGQDGDLTNQASAKAMERAQAQNATIQDMYRAHDAAFTNPYTPANSNGLYNGPALGPNWTGYLAENGAGGGSNQRSDAGTNGTSANGNPLPYVDQDLAWLKVAASMCLAPEVVAAIRLWKLSEASWQDFLPDAQKRLDMAKSKYGDSDAVMSARKPDIKEIDQIVKDLGLNRDQRRLLHDEITKQDLSIEEIRAIAEDIGRQFPKGGR